MKSTTFLSNGESVFLFQNFHHAADHRGLLVAEGGDVQKALVLPAQQIVHRHAEQVGDAQHDFKEGLADVDLVAGTTSATITCVHTFPWGMSPNLAA